MFDQDLISYVAFCVVILTHARPWIPEKYAKAAGVITEILDVIVGNYGNARNKNPEK